MAQQGSTQAIERLTDEQRDCLRLVAELLSSKEIARRLHISPNTVDNRLKRAQAILGVSTRADAAKLFLRALPEALESYNQPCESLADQSLALAKRKYARNRSGTDHIRDNGVGDAVRAFEDSGVAYTPMSFSFETLSVSWLSLFARGDVDNELTVPARVVMIMLLMITLALCMAVLVVVAEGLSRLS
jgi:DNA-binding CsgD family transcriptional regulator